MSSTEKAGRLLRLLGWISLSLTIVIGAAILIPTIDRGDELSSDSQVALVVAAVVTGVYLFVGAALKKHRPWARPVAAIVSLVSLLNVPLGTLIGGIALFYLVRGWRETSPEEATTGVLDGGQP